MTKTEQEQDRSSTKQDEPNLPHINIAEKGRSKEGKPISLNRRLFMQFAAFGNCEIGTVVELLDKAQPQVVLYQDANDPHGIGLVAFSEKADYFLEEFHPFLRSLPKGTTQKDELSMMGRTYSIGYEHDLEDVLINRPRSRVVDKKTPWAVWYPVRRSGRFEQESSEEQRKMLMEHGRIGHAYGKAGLATDIRLAAHGLNQQDHGFIIGLLGKELLPLSALVQRMRRTRQTSEFIESLGPFFIGKAIWQPK